MDSGFDPYHVWLGIPKQEQPPTFYRLLGLDDFESSIEVIDNATQRLTGFLRNKQIGEHQHLSQQLLTEIAQAHSVLSDPVRKHDYDFGLRQSHQRSQERSFMEPPRPAPAESSHSDMNPPDLFPPARNPSDLNPPDLSPPDLSPPDLSPPELSPLEMPPESRSLDDSSPVELAPVALESDPVSPDVVSSEPVTLEPVALDPFGVASSRKDDPVGSIPDDTGQNVATFDAAANEETSGEDQEYNLAPPVPRPPTSPVTSRPSSKPKTRHPAIMATQIALGGLAGVGIAAAVLAWMGKLEDLVGRSPTSGTNKSQVTSASQPTTGKKLVSPKQGNTKQKPTPSTPKQAVVEQKRSTPPLPQPNKPGKKEDSKQQQPKRHEPKRLVRTPTKPSASSGKKVSAPKPVRVFDPPKVELTETSKDTELIDAELGWREWTSKAGTTIEARFRKYKDSKITLKQRDGKLVTVARSDFARKDQDYLREVLLQLKDLESPDTIEFSSGLDYALSPERLRVLDTATTTVDRAENEMFTLAQFDARRDGLAISFEVARGYASIAVKSESGELTLDPGQNLFKSGTTYNVLFWLERARARMVINGKERLTHFAGGEHRHVALRLSQGASLDIRYMKIHDLQEALANQVRASRAKAKANARRKRIVNRRQNERESAMKMQNSISRYWGSALRSVYGN